MEYIHESPRPKHCEMVNFWNEEVIKAVLESSTCTPNPCISLFQRGETETLANVKSTPNDTQQKTVERSNNLNKKGETRNIGNHFSNNSNKRSYVYNGDCENYPVAKRLKSNDERLCDNSRITNQLANAINAQRNDNFLLLQQLQDHMSRSSLAMKPKDSDIPFNCGMATNLCLSDMNAGLFRSRYEQEVRSSLAMKSKSSETPFNFGMTTNLCFSDINVGRIRSRYEQEVQSLKGNVTNSKYSLSEDVKTEPKKSRYIGNGNLHNASFVQHSRTDEQDCFDIDDWNPKHVNDWEEMFTQLMSYFLNNGHCNVPVTFPQNPKLGRWITLQRHNYKRRRNGLKSPMSLNRIESLESIGFEWECSKRSTWIHMFSKLKGYKETKGHCLVPQNFKENPKLGRWVDKQRHSYKCRKEGKSTPLSLSQIEQLEDIGFVWSINKQQSWPEMYQELKKYHKVNGNCLVPANFDDSPKLGRWVSQQRYHYKRWCSGKQSPMDTDVERIQKLESIGFSWNVPRKIKRAASDTYL